MVSLGSVCTGEWEVAVLARRESRGFHREVLMYLGVRRSQAMVLHMVHRRALVCRLNPGSGKFRDRKGRSLWDRGLS